MTIPPRLRRALVRLRRDLLFLAAGVPLHAVPLLLSFWVLLQLQDILGPASDFGTLVLPVPVTLLILAAYGLTEAQRWRFRALCGVDLPRLRFRESKRQWAYNCLIGPLFGLLELLVLGVLAAALTAATSLLWVELLGWEWRVDHRGSGPGPVTPRPWACSSWPPYPPWPAASYGWRTSSAARCCTSAGPRSSSGGSRT